MNRAICIPFHRYQPHNTHHYRVFFDFLLKSLSIWGDEFDALYLIDSDFNFTDKDIHALEAKCKKVKILPSSGSHWENLRVASKKIIENQVLFMDQDVLIWDKGIIKGWFEQAIGWDVLTAFDGSGGMIERIQKRYGLMKAHDAARMGTYYFILNRKALALMGHTDLAPIRFEANAYIRELDLHTKKDDWLDSFGYFTLRLLYNDFLLRSFRDNRASIYLNSQGVFGDPNINLDKPGYYHMRNGNLPIYILNNLGDDCRDHLERCLEITPSREILRLLAWHKWIGLDEGGVIRVLAQLKVEKGVWDDYYAKFKEYHGL